MTKDSTKVVDVFLMSLLVLLFSVSSPRTILGAETQKPSEADNYLVTYNNEGEDLLIESFVAEYALFPQDLKEAIYQEVREMNLGHFEDNTVFIESARLEKNWGILTIRGKDNYDTGEFNLSGDIEIREGTREKIVFASDKEGKYQVAYKGATNIINVLDSIDENELSLESKYAMWDYPISENQKSDFEALSVAPKFPWQSYTPYRVSSSRYPEWHLDGLGMWAIDMVPTVSAEDARRALSPITGTVTDVCRGSTQSYMVLRDANGVDYYSILHLITSSIPTSIQDGSSISQGNYLGNIYYGSHNQTGACPQNTTGTHLHLGLPSQNFVLDGYRFTTTTPTSTYLKLTTRSGQTLVYPNITSHNLVSTLPADIYTVTMNCQNGSSGSYCLDNVDPHVLKGKMTKGTNPAGKSYLQVQVPKVAGTPYLYGGKVKVYDVARGGYISKLDYSNSVTAGLSELSYSAGITVLTFYIDPTYLNINEENNLSVRVFPSNGGSFYINYHKAKRQQG